jgi:hypothetical protein
MTEQRHFRTGDAVQIEHDGRWIPGNVVMASGNGRSLMLSFDGIIDGHVAMMPVLLDDDGVYRTLYGDGEPVKLK